MRRISLDQWRTFTQACRELEEALGMPIGHTNIHNMFQIQMGGLFLDGQSAVVMLVADPAFNETGRETGVHFVAVSCGFPQFREGIDQPTLAIKIIDMGGDPAGMLLEYDIWPDGRRSLETAGLRLHVNDEFSRYAPAGTIVGDYRSRFSARPALLAIAHKIIQTFPARGARTIAAQQEALSELDAVYA